MGGVVNAVTKVFDTVTGDALDLDGSKQKKETKKLEKQMKAQQEEEKKKQEEEKAKQKQTTQGFYESMRDGNLGLLQASSHQKIG